MKTSKILSAQSYLKIFSFILFLFCFCSCGTSVTDYLYVQDVDVKGPINQPPIRVTGRDSTVFTISPKFFYNSNKRYNGLIDGHTKVDSKNIFEVDTVISGSNVTYTEVSDANTYEFKGENLHWNIPDYFVGLDFDIAISRKAALSGGFSMSAKDKTNLYGYRVGLGFFSQSENMGFRFDGGVIWQKYSYAASSVVIRHDGSANSEVIFFKDKGSSTNLNLYLKYYFKYNL